MTDPRFDVWDATLTKALKDLIAAKNAGAAGVVRVELDEAYGRTRWVRDEIRVANAPPPEPPPPPPAPTKLFLGAIVVVAGNMDVELLRAAGVTKVAFALTVPNMTDWKTSRWAGFEKGAFWVSKDRNVADEAAELTDWMAEGQFSFAVVDTERHKADLTGGSLQWTYDLYQALTAPDRLARVPLYNITFGLDSSTSVVNHDALRAFGVASIFEAYNGDGYSYGVEATAKKAIAEGWDPPQVCLGDKSLTNDAGWVTKLTRDGLLGPTWLWAPDNGPAQEALRAGAAATLKAALV